MDAEGGNGNGLAWFASPDALLTHSDYYLSFSQQKFAALDVPTLKSAIGASYGSAESAPIVNYLVWLLTIAEAIA
jgi:hypothetical protein